MQHSVLAGRPLGVVNGARLGASVPAGRAFTAVYATADSRKARVAERHRRLRNKLSGSEERPRLAVFRSNQHIYAQVIDDTAADGVGATLAAASTVQKDIKTALEGNGATKTAAEAVGKKIAELCLAKNITKVAFDRGGFLYHGRVQAVAEAARAAGLSF